MGNRLAKIGVIVAFATSLLTSPPALGEEIESPGITAIIRKYFPEGAEGGLAILITRDGTVLHCKGYGLKDGKTPITPETPMPLASDTKQFAAMCAAMLIEEGKLHLTDKVSTHLPEIRIAENGRELLVQDLLWHISGLPNFINAAEKASIEEYKRKHGLGRLTNETHAQWLATLPLRRPPGEAYEYTNSGYVLLARVIEVVAEKPFHQFQQERIFDVLGMTHTTDSHTFNGSGNMATSLEDYLKWDRALWDGTLLQEETSKLLFQSGKLDNGELVGYGFGWRVEFADESLIEVSHGGVGSPKASARNLVTRDIKNRITVALFVRENLKFTKSLKRTLADEVRDYVRLLD